MAGLILKKVTIQLNKTRQNATVVQFCLEKMKGMEIKGEDNILLRAKTAATADKSELSKEYFDTYNQLKALAEQEIKLLLEEKDSRIRSLETMVMTA